VDQEVDTLAGTVKTVDEEAYDFFRCLYEVRGSWNIQGFRAGFE
jgi:hypothetical protein